MEGTEGNRVLVRAPGNRNVPLNANRSHLSSLAIPENAVIM